jgi:hypothetical protein
LWLIVLKILCFLFLRGLYVVSGGNSCVIAVGKKKMCAWLTFIIHRESRCLPLAHNKKDPVTIAGVKGSLGLFQINLVLDFKNNCIPERFSTNCVAA